MCRHKLVWIVLYASLAASAAAKPQVFDEGTIIQNVTVISPERAIPLTNASVVIREGKIFAIGTELAAGTHAKQVDGHGGFLIPGLIDSHVHVGNQGPLDDNALDRHPELLAAYRAQLPRSYLAFGFTTIVDLDLKPDTLAWFNAAPVHPNFCSCGRGVRIVGVYMALKPPKDAATANAKNLVYEKETKDWPANLDPKDYSPARAVARAQETGAICLKTFIEPGFGGAAHWPTPKPATLRALREEAKRQGLVFVVHANALESWRAAIDARADVIAHGLWHWPGEQMNPVPTDAVRDVIRAAARAHIAVQPTLRCTWGDLSIFDPELVNDPRFAEALPASVVAYLKGDEGKAAHSVVAEEYRQAIAGLFGKEVDPPHAMSIGAQRASASLKMMSRENVELIFGTDTPSNEGVGNPPGLNGRLELDHWADAGVPLPKILRAATIDNANVFGMSDRGTIEVGKRADLVLLRKNPLQEVAAYDSIETIFLNGETLPRPSLVAR